MSKVTHIKKGLTINLQGKPERIFHQLPLAEKVAVKPTDFVGLKPKLSVKEGDTVLAGDALFYDKYNPDILFTSPVSGTVELINRGERRKILEVVVKTENGKVEYKKFNTPEINRNNRDAIKKSLLESGLWPCIIQRPYACIANPSDTPKAIFISTFDTAPLAPDYTFLISEYKSEFLKGIEVLNQLTDGKTHVNIYQETRANNPFQAAKDVQINYFSGKHPAGNVGIQIHHLDPINKGDVVWTVKPQDVVLIGRFFEKSIFDARKIIALTGNVRKPYYFKTILGASVNSMLNNQITSDKEQRIISGNVLTGTQVNKTGYVGFYDTQISVINEGNYPEFMGWINPGFNKFSFYRSFFSWLQPDREFKVDTNYHGGERPFVFTGQYERVLPMNIYPIHLLKSILVNDIDKMEQLGIFEVAEEDFALCEFVCPSKIEIQSIIRQGLDTIKKEFS
ncbi:MAG: Na(+)-translocating NADH-quinone reductase subunit A [Bacteroidota bacterium]